MPVTASVAPARRHSRPTRPTWGFPVGRPRVEPTASATASSGGCPSVPRPALHQTRDGLEGRQGIRLRLAECSSPPDDRNAPDRATMSRTVWFPASASSIETPVADPTVVEGDASYLAEAVAAADDGQAWPSGSSATDHRHGPALTRVARFYMRTVETPLRGRGRPGRVEPVRSRESAARLVPSRSPEVPP